MHVLQGWCRRPDVGKCLRDRYMQQDGNTRRSGCTIYGTATALKVIGIWLHLTRSVVFYEDLIGQKAHMSLPDLSQARPKFLSLF